MRTKARARSIVGATIGLAVAAGMSLVATSPPSSAADSRAVRPQTVTPTGTTYAIVKTVPVGGNNKNVAVNDVDDTIYTLGGGALLAISGADVDDSVQQLLNRPGPGLAVGQADDTVYLASAAGASGLWVVNGRDTAINFRLPLSASPTFTTDPFGVAVNQVDDSVYVSQPGIGRLVVLSGSTDDSRAVVLPGVQTLASMAVNSADDSVYVGLDVDDKLLVMNGRNTDDSAQVDVGDRPTSVAVNQVDDTVYVVNQLGNSLSIINGRDLDDSAVIPVLGNAWDVAVDQRDDTIYVVGLANSLTIINARTLDDSVVMTFPSGSTPYAVAVDNDGANQGLVYVANDGSYTMSVVAQVSPSASPTSGSIGSTASISVSAPQVPYDVEDGAVTAVSFGGNFATGLTAGIGDTWTVTVPAGSGTVPVTAYFAGGLSASAGTFTYSSTPGPGPQPGPAPVPTYPPSAPRDVTGVAGDGQAVVSWVAPASSGSFPITNYEAVVSPGGQSCLVQVPELSCAIDGLANGTGYTARVRALNGAGWGAYSVPSGEFTPVAPVVQAISITGTRGDVRGKAGIQVTGQTSGFEVGASLRPWHRFPGQTGYTEGFATIRVKDDGSFRWQRRTGKTITVVVRSMDGTVESNRLVLAAG